MVNAPQIVKNHAELAFIQDDKYGLPRFWHIPDDLDYPHQKLQLICYRDFQWPLQQGKTPSAELSPTIVQVVAAWIFTARSGEGGTLFAERLSKRFSPACRD